MATKSTKPSVPPGWHPSLKKAFRDADLWWQNFMVNKDRLSEGRSTLRQELDTTRPFIPALSTLLIIAHAYGMQSCTSDTVVEIGGWNVAFRNAIGYRALDFRKLASLSLPHGHQPIRAFSGGLKAVGPALLSQWDLAEDLARLLFAVAEKERRLNPSKKSSWQRGTSDAFLIGLLSDALSIPTSFESINPLVPEYEVVLRQWRTTDADEFRAAMNRAAEFHISRSRDSTEKTDYEFDNTFDRLYPAELLVVQALRRRDGLPEFDTEHTLIDKPWSLIRDSEPTTTDPLIAETESALRRDHPNFR